MMTRRRRILDAAVVGVFAAAIPVLIRPGVPLYILAAVFLLAFIWWLSK